MYELNKIKVVSICYITLIEYTTVLYNISRSYKSGIASRDVTHWDFLQWLQSYGSMSYSNS